MQLRQPLGQLGHDRVPGRDGDGVTHQPDAPRLAREPGHDAERPAEDRGVRARGPGLWRRHTDPVRDLEDCVLLQARVALGHAGGGGGAQHEPMRAGPRAAIDRDIERQVLLDGTAAQPLQPGDRHLIGGERRREPGRQRCTAGLAQGHAKKPRPSAASSRATTIRWTSEAPSTSRAWRA